MHPPTEISLPAESLLNAIGTLVLITDLRGEIVSLNTACLKLLGRRADEIVGHRITSLCPEHDKAKVRLTCDRLRRGESPVHHECHWVDSAGRSHLIEWTHARLGAEPSGEQVLVTGIDVTEHRRAEEALRRSEKIYRSAIAASSGVPYRLVTGTGARYGIYEFMDRGIERLLGLPVSEVTPQRFVEMIVETWLLSPQGFRDSGELSRAFAAGEVNSYHAEVLVRRPNGTLRWLSDHSVPLRDEVTGHVIGSLGILHDIHNQRRIESELRSNAERLRAIFNNAAVGIGIVEDGRFTQVNARLAEMFNVTEETLVGMSPLDFASPEEHAGIERRMRELMSGAAPLHREERSFMRRGGDVFWGEISAAPILGADGRPRALMGMLSDISDAHRLEKEILEISDRIQRQIGQDLHDGPCQDMTAISMMARALGKSLASQHPHWAEEVSRIECLLMETAQRTRTLAKSLYPLDLQEHGLIEALRGLAEKTESLHGITCTLVATPEITPLDIETETHLYRLVQEALSNIVRHAGATVAQIVLQERDDQITLTVQDNGLGLPREESRGRGMGIGIMRHRAKLIGATLKIDTLPQGGTAVICSFFTGERRGT
ncbi:PAS domain S-box protein [Candidatus Sumerlaeota bacterium]|nr:PAS domain S-box protein [Candidatus Sumerlaeota bacterium]